MTERGKSQSDRSRRGITSQALLQFIWKVEPSHQQKTSTQLSFVSVAVELVVIKAIILLKKVAVEAAAEVVEG